MMKYEKFESKNRLKSANIFYILLIIFTIMLLPLIYYGSGTFFKNLVSLLILVCFYIYPSKLTSRIEFTNEFCYISSAPFLKHKYRLEDVIFINYKKLFFVKIDEPLYKIPFYMVVLDRDEETKFIKYIVSREKIENKVL